MLAAGTDFFDALIPDSSVSTGLRWGRSKNPLQPSGALYETFERQGTPITNNAFLVSQRLGMIAIDLPSGEVVTSISFISSATALSVGVHQLFGLYDSSRNLLRGSNDDTNVAWAANTVKTLALTSTFTTTYSGLHYLGILVEATTVPSLWSVVSANIFVHGIAPITTGLSSTGVSALPNPAGAITAMSIQPYAWVS